MSERFATLPPMATSKHNTIPLDSLRDSYQMALKSRRKSPATVKLYLRCIDRYLSWLTENGLPLDPAESDRRQLEAYFGWMADQVSASTCAIEYRSLRAFFGWLTDEDELDANPFTKMRQPTVPDEPPRVLTDEQLADLFRSCRGRDFADRRDRAILLFLIDTGVRPGELVGLTMDSLDLDHGRALVTGKTGARYVALGASTLEALDRWLRARSTSKYAGRPEVWLGERGPITHSGLAQLLRKRGAAVGVEKLSPYDLRHRFVHAWLTAGGNEGDLQSLAGWSSPAMIRRYARATSNERAIEAHRGISPADKLSGL